jgi:hypothetical protein
MARGPGRPRKQATLTSRGVLPTFAKPDSVTGEEVSIRRRSHLPRMMLLLLRMQKTQTRTNKNEYDFSYSEISEKYYQLYSNVAIVVSDDSDSD